MNIKFYSRLRTSAKATVGRAVASARIKRYVRQTDMLKLNIGCGSNTLPGWLNVDLRGGWNNAVWMDATCTFPIPEGSFEAVLCEHMIEHIPKEKATGLITEVFRVLKPGGKFRVITPDLGAIVDLYRNPIDARAQSYLDFVGVIHCRKALFPGDAINLLFYEYGHRHIFSISELRQMLEKVGFVNVAVGRAGYPVDNVFANAEGHVHFMGLANNAFEAFALEGTKAG